MSEPMPVVVDGKRYGYSDAVYFGPLYRAHGSDNLYLYDEEAELPYEVSEGGSLDVSLPGSRPGTCETS